MICSSRAGREAVQQVLEIREKQIQLRTGADLARLRSQRPRLPVIPLPLPPESLDFSGLRFDQARQQLGIDPKHAVVIWLGRLSLLTKIDPWPTYALLERVSRQLGRPLVFIECGPDDKPSSHDSFERLRRLCPSVQFLRLGGNEPVSEKVKRQALAAADVAISLVDNAQETFGLAVAEAMAAGLPVVASDWSGYRDLVRDGIDGFLVPTAWASSAPSLSVSLGWQQFTGIQSFPAIAGALAQLVQIDMVAAETALLTLLTQPTISRAMGSAAASRARIMFSSDNIMNSHEELFAELNEIRSSAPKDAHQVGCVSPQIDPVRVFAGFASHPLTSLSNSVCSSESLPEPVSEQRNSLWSILKSSAQQDVQRSLDQDLARKHKQI